MHTRKVQVGLFRRRKGRKTQELGRKDADEAGNTTYTCCVCVETPKETLPFSMKAEGMLNERRNTQKQGPALRLGRSESGD